MTLPIPSNSCSEAALPATVAVIGGGPAGLMAAEVISAHGIAVDLYDAMPSLGRKFLLAGIGGLNLTHAEPTATFLTRYGADKNAMRELVTEFDATSVRQWAQDLGVETFVGSSGRVFPTGMKAAPLLRSWLRRLRAASVQLHVRHRWIGWNESGELQFQTPAGIKVKKPHAVLFALGGGSWARLGSDGAWVPLLQQRDVAISPLLPANCGFDRGWSEFFRERFAGQPLKSIAINLHDTEVTGDFRRGECVITRAGIEGSLIYALSTPIRDEIMRTGSCTIYLDLTPDRSRERIDSELAKPRGSHSLAKHLHSRIGIDGVKSALLHEVLSVEQFKNNELLARTIKALPLQLTAPRPLDEAISTAGGVRFESLDNDLMLKAIPGYFCAGEMLDWEAPTGGYLLTGCLASGRRAGLGVLEWLRCNK
jgi:uncharacterized flavoprotein (TIGR03862 family)